MIIFEPAMCCATGICGPGVDPELLRVSTVISNLKNKGIEVKRYNLSGNPKVFIDNKVINEVINIKGVEELPVTILDDSIVKEKAYPTNEEFCEFLGITEDYLKTKATVKARKKVVDAKMAVAEKEKRISMLKNFSISDIKLTKYLFFTGKGGVGKTSTACATAVLLADAGKKIMLISTDPASNLQDVFNTELTPTRVLLYQQSQG